MNRIKTVLLASASALVMVSYLAGTAAAQTASSGKVVESANDNINLTLSGQVNRMLNIANDGENTEVFHVDNDNSSTRFRLVGKGQVNNDVSLGSTIEVQMESNSSANVDQDNERGIGGTSFTERKLEAWFQSKRLGKLSIGQGDTASNGTSEVDLSGTTVIGYSGIADAAGGLEFRDKNLAGSPLSGIDINDAWSNLDGQSRDDRLRYDTPSFGGFKASVSAIADGAWDVAARFGRDFGGVRVAGAAAYGQPHNGSDIDYRLNGSASVLLTGIGLSFTGALGLDGRDDAQNDPFFWYTKLGWQSRNLVPMGGTAFSVDFGIADEIRVVNEDILTIGFQAVQRIAGYGTELYVGVRYHDLDSNAADTDPIIVGSVGTRIKF